MSDARHSAPDPAPHEADAGALFPGCSRADGRVAGDRRGAPRLTVQRPCKVYDERRQRYVAGETCDLSEGGALLMLQQPVNYHAGDRLHLGIALTRRQALLRHDDMVPVEVVRASLQVDDRTAVAVRFLDAGVVNEPLILRLAA